MTALSNLFYYSKWWFSPYINHFISADTIVASYANPQALNRYSYVTNNPLKYTDPTGHMQCEDNQGACISANQITKNESIKHEKFKLAHKIHEKFNNITVKDPSSWLLRDLDEIQYALYQINGMYGFDGNTDAISAAFGHVTFASAYIPGKDAGYATWSTGLIQLEADGATADTVIHEMGHILDGSLKRLNNHVPSYSSIYGNVFDAGSGATQYARDKNSPSEDFADSFLAVNKYGSTASQHVSEPRINIISALIQSYTNSDHTFSPGR